MKSTFSPRISTRLLVNVGLVVLAGSQLACSSQQSAPKTLAAGANCQQLGNDNPVLKRFYEPGTVTSAKPIEKRIFLARALQPKRTVGASLYVAAEPDLNGPYLRRVLACHVDSGVSAHPNDPLHPSKGEIAELEVNPVRNGFVVNVVSDEPSVGEEIWNRAKSLTEDRAAVEVEQVSQLPDLEHSL